MNYRNYTLVIGCTAFIVVGVIALGFGASVTTAAFRAVVAAFIGGLFGFCMDYFAAQAPTGSSRRMTVGQPSASPSRSAERESEEA